MNRVLMAAGVAVANSHHSDQGSIWKSSVNTTTTVHPGLKRLISGVAGESPDVHRSMAGIAADESVRQVMFINCWGPS